MKDELYISVDIEASGPIPLEYSMLSLGAAAFLKTGELIDTFEINLEELPSAQRYPDTMRWWATQPKAWEECRKNLIDPKTAMNRFDAWVHRVSSKTGTVPIFVAYPSGFDFTFVYVYLMKFVGHSRFSFSALDIKSYASAVMKKPFRQTVKKSFPKKWMSKKRHTHIAIDDAICQGEIFMNILKENQNTN